MPTIAAAVICLFGGLYSLHVALLDWKKSQRDYRAQLVISVLGEKGARGFYVVLGLVVVALGIGASLAAWMRK